MNIPRSFPLPTIVAFIGSLYLLLPVSAFAQKADLKKGLQLLSSKQLGAAQEFFEDIIKTDSTHTAAYFALAQTYFEQYKTLREQQKHQVRLLNIQPQLDLLKKSHQTAADFNRLYTKLESRSKEDIRRLLAVSEQMLTTDFAQIIMQEAFQLINQAPYRRALNQMFGSKIYDRVTESDTVIALRRLLVQQCRQYISAFPKSTHVSTVRQIAREMLQEYLSMEQLRRSGERDGREYEQFCELILTYCTADEYRHVLPEFYGAYFGFNKQNYLRHHNYFKLKELSQKFNLSPESLLCELNLHNAGYTPEKQALYEAFINTFAPEDVALVAIKKMAEPAIIKREWENARTIFKRYRQLFPGKDNYFAKMDALLAEPEGEKKLENLGTAINSDKREYNPVLTLDGRTLYFSRRAYNTGEDVFVSQWDGKEWSQAKPLDKKINTESHETPLAISPDGQTLFLFGNYYMLPNFFYVIQDAQLGKGDYYFAEKQGNSWSKISAMPNPVNSVYFESGFSMSADGSAILFASDRPGNVGGYFPNYNPNYLYYHGSGEFNVDIYVSLRTENGWSTPINLGKVINTPFAENSPWLHPDMRTLYFTSDGHPGLGSYDVFVSRRLREDSWTEWSEPVNLGKAINSAGSDAIHITADGKTALVVSSQPGNSYGETDIYRITIPEPHRAEPVVVVTGTVIDSNGKPVTKAQITWQATDNSQKGTASVQPNGRFSIPLKRGKKYRYQPVAPDYFSGSQIVDLTQTPATTLVIEQPAMEMGSLNKSESKGFVINSLEFDFDSDVIRPQSLHDLDRLAALLQDNSLMLHIEGHTDDKGSDEFNLSLSRRRAEAVKKYLLAKGCKAQIIAKGFGKTQPIAPNTTEEGRQKNRRVEFRVE
ncbi:OmpA family protein [Rhodoflexus caldus]|uniref:OmpA family protein n=1 Tax=Rhodoflexus caldus TaxID=2891236 RepID=UPI00202ABE62|nr:OmpA family protein [Rhodoflexus caldus]